MKTIGRKTKPPKAPGHLSVESKKFWRWAAEAFILEPHDLRLLQLACENLDGAAAARRQLETEGRTYLDARGNPRTHPCVMQHRDCSVVAARILRELRLSEPANDARPPRLGGQ
jgi:phage terminase small subunit